MKWNKLLSENEDIWKEKLINSVWYDTKGCLVLIKTTEAAQLKSKNDGGKLPYCPWVWQKLQTLSAKS